LADSNSQTFPGAAKEITLDLFKIIEVDIMAKKANTHFTPARK
jgi:hypothetical protein